LGRVDGTVPLCLTEFVTPKESGGLTLAGDEGNLMLTFDCNELDRQMIWTRIHFGTYV
jgi:hypothetical protein